MGLKEIFSKLSMSSANALGSPWMFVANVALILVWLFSGPFFHYSDTWQLVVNTATTVITYLAVFLIQNTQNRDAMAVHLKLDEIIRGTEGPRDRFVNLENVTDDELIELEAHFRALREKAEAGDKEAVEDVADDIREKVVDKSKPPKKKKKDNGSD
jgi:low affinity Fe/Cu permease